MLITIKTMELAKHLYDILFREDRVVVPGLGGFILRPVSASFSEDGKVLLPPSTDLLFDSGMIEDDGVLVGFISARLNRPEREVQELISEEVATLVSQISKGAKVNLARIGSLSFGPEKGVIFEAEADSNFLKNSYGLAPLSMPVLEPDKQAFYRRSVLFRRPVNAPRKPLPGSVETKAKKTFSGELILLALMVFVVLVLLPYNSRISESVFQKPSSLGPLPSLVELEPPLVDHTPVTERPVLAKAEEEIESSHSAGLIPVIAASFENLRNAEELANQLIARGYSPSIVKVKNFYRVVMSEYPSMEEAEKAMEQFKRTNPQLDLWIPR